MSDLRSEISRRRTFAIISPFAAGKNHPDRKRRERIASRESVRFASDWMEIEKPASPSPPPSCSFSTYPSGPPAFASGEVKGYPKAATFSEDTYRTLMAADSAVMVIDGAKGVEPQTRKLFRVCAIRHIPIFTFINKMDREAKDPLELCEELEKELGIDTYAVNWPIGSGKEFQGVYDREKQRIPLLLRRRVTAKRLPPPRWPWTTRRWRT